MDQQPQLDFHILLVETEPAACSLYSTRLSLEGFRVTSIKNLEEMERVARSGDRFQLVILDRLPGELEHAFSSALISGKIAVSGVALFLDEVTGLKQRFEVTKRIVKPFRIEDLVFVVKLLAPLIGAR